MAVVVLRRAHPGKAGIAGCFLGEEAEGPVWCFAEASAFVLFCLVQLSLWDRAHCCPCNRHGDVLASRLRTSVCLCSKGPVALWSDSEFGATLG